MSISDITSILLEMVVAIVLAIVTKYIIPALKNYIEEHTTSRVQDVITTAVRAAEQTVTGSGEGKIKKKQVVDLVTKYLQERGISLSSEQLDQMIEECVYLITKES